MTILRRFAPQSPINTHWGTNGFKWWLELSSGPINGIRFVGAYWFGLVVGQKLDSSMDRPRIFLKGFFGQAQKRFGTVVTWGCWGNLLPWEGV